MFHLVDNVCKCLTFVSAIESEKHFVSVKEHLNGSPLYIY